MLRIHRIITQKTIANWQDDLLIGLNAGVALAHLRILSGQQAVTEFKRLLGAAWAVYQTGHTLSLEKNGVQIVFADVLDADDDCFIDAPAQIRTERVQQGLGLPQN